MYCWRRTSNIEARKTATLLETNLILILILKEPNQFFANKGEIFNLLPATFDFYFNDFALYFSFRICTVNCGCKIIAITAVLP